jgi:4-amino-4-deoxy-L-arabinose transferase-like glycosyltransferase
VLHHPVFAGDALIYGGIARNLLTHGVYGFNTQTLPSGVTVVLPTLIRLPGYPLFLAACFRLFGLEDYVTVLYVQIAADLLTCLLLASAARRLFDRRAGLAALALACLCPFTANYVAVPITETLVLLSIALAIYALPRWFDAGLGLNPWIWVLGAALSASLLLRPDQGLLAAAFLPAILWLARAPSPPSIRSAAPAIVATLLIAAPLVPWTARNWHTFHRFQPLAPRSATDPGERPPTGFNRWYRTWAIDFASTDQVYWNMNGDRIDPAALPNRAFALGCTARGVPREQLPLYAPTLTLLDQYNRTTTDTPALDQAFAGVAARKAAAEPLCNLALLPLARLGNMLLRPRTELMAIPDQWWRASRMRDAATALLLGAVNLLYLVLGLCGLKAAMAWVMPGRPLHPEPRDEALILERTVLAVTVATILMRAALLLTLDNSEPRYTLEFFPILILWASACAMHKPAQSTAS